MTNTRSSKVGITTRAAEGNRAIMPYRPVLIAFACTLTVLIASPIAAAAGYLARRDQATYPSAISRAATAFTAVLLLAAALTTALATLTT